MEMADAIAINKADGDSVGGAQRAQLEFQRALHLYPPKENGWIPRVTKCSARENTGIREIWGIVEDFVGHTRENGSFEKNRKGQNRHWFLQGVERLIWEQYRRDPAFIARREALLKQVEAGRISPFHAARTLMGQLELKDLNLHRSKTE